MTLPNPGVSLSLLQIYNEAQLSASSPWYNAGPNLGGYRGVQWWKDDTSTGYFPNTNISVNDFYSKRSTSPVTPGSQSFYGNGTFTVPLYSTLTVTIRSGAGGGGGCSGNTSGGGAGNSGGTSYFGPYSAAAGSGGGPGGNAYNGTPGGGSDGAPAGGSGGSSSNGTSGGSGGAGGKNVLVFTNPISGGSGPAVGSSVAVYIGGGGSGGSGGSFYNGFAILGLPGGSSGGSGWVVVQWS